MDLHVDWNLYIICQKNTTQPLKCHYIIQFPVGTKLDRMNHFWQMWVSFGQWKWPAAYGEQKFVVMLGGLHTEMALWNMLGDVLESSGWIAALVVAEVASYGTAASFLKVTHLTGTRNAHQIILGLSKSFSMRLSCNQPAMNLKRSGWRTCANGALPSCIGTSS